MLKPCQEQGCPELVPRGESWCQKHRPDQPYRSTFTRIGLSDAEWARLKRRVRVRDRRRCVLCGAPGTEVDHIVPYSMGGSNDLSNLRLLCHDCHVRETPIQMRGGHS